MVVKGCLANPQNPKENLKNESRSSKTNRKLVLADGRHPPGRYEAAQGVPEHVDSFLYPVYAPSYRFAKPGEWVFLTDKEVQACDTFEAEE